MQNGWSSPALTLLRAALGSLSQQPLYDHDKAPAYETEPARHRGHNHAGEEEQGAPSIASSKWMFEITYTAAYLDGKLAGAASADRPRGPPPLTRGVQHFPSFDAAEHNRADQQAPSANNAGIVMIKILVSRAMDQFCA
jgi:hypothetical protein